jgi:hypothetical protein
MPVDQQVQAGMWLAIGALVALWFAVATWFVERRDRQRAETRDRAVRVRREQIRRDEPGEPVDASVIRILRGAEQARRHQ